MRPLRRAVRGGLAACYAERQGRYRRRLLYDTDIVALRWSATAKTFLTVNYLTGDATLVARQALFVEREGTHSQRALSRRATRVRRGSAPTF